MKNERYPMQSTYYSISSGKGSVFGTDLFRSTEDEEGEEASYDEYEERSCHADCCDPDCECDDCLRCSEWNLKDDFWEQAPSAS